VNVGATLTNTVDLYIDAMYRSISKALVSAKIPAELEANSHLYRECSKRYHEPPDLEIAA